MRHQSSHLCFFDAFGTLFRPKTSVAEVYARIGEAHGLHLLVDEIRLELRSALEAQFGPESDRRSDPQRERERWQAVVRRVFLDAPQWKSIFDELWKHYAEPAAWELYEDVFPALTTLARLGVPAGIASNFDDRLHGICKALIPSGLVRWVLVSAELGWRKPDPRFFHGVADGCGATPDRLWMVGDQWALDVQPALNAGWAAVMLDRRRTSQSAIPRGVPHISGLNELIPMLDRSPE